jgi:two-component system LytT family sensor kinase
LPGLERRLAAECGGNGVELEAMIEPKLILITLLVKLGVAAAFSSALARSRVFKDLLLAKHRSRGQLLGLLAFICIPLTLGVWIRVIVPNFLAADIAFETIIILGVLFGPFASGIGALALSLPAMLHHQYLTLPVNLVVAAVAGMYGTFADKEEVWSFTPLIDLSIYRWIRRNLKQPRFDRQIVLLLLIVVMQVGTGWLAVLYPKRYFALHSNIWSVSLAIYVCAPMVVGIPIKIWNAIRIERKLEEQERLLLGARLDALQRQINPHFLFNTLNSIASLVRFKPELARVMIVKLANILRVLLKDREAFVPFREEIGFTDDYLDIEVVRFGAEKLQVVKEMEPETLDIIVPSMLLQPLIENSIKHGLEPRISGGTITLRSRVLDDKLVVEVEDDGVGMPPEKDVPSPVSGLVRPGTGIGMRNVRERLAVLYGDAARMEVVSRPGRGTRITLVMPVLQTSGDLPWPQKGNGEAAERQIQL